MRDTEKAILILILFAVFSYLGSINTHNTQLNAVLVGGIVICICAIVFLFIIGTARAVLHPAKAPIRRNIRER